VDRTLRLVMGSKDGQLRTLDFSDFHLAGCKLRLNGSSSGPAVSVAEGSWAECPASFYSGHTAGVRGVSLGLGPASGSASSSLASTLVSVSNDKTVNVYSVPERLNCTGTGTGTVGATTSAGIMPLYSLRVHTKQVTAIQFDETKIITASADATVNIAMCAGAVW
jgi:WD40 repeat protein